MNFDLVKTIFEQAIDLPPEAREQFLLDQSSGDQDIIAEVHSLLSCTTEEDDDEETLDPIIGIFAGPWLIETRIGGGGMGRVYSATDPKTNKQAAVKVLRRVLIDRSAAKRFEQEIRVLGRINHDGVARIKGAGTLELDGDRVPWVAMELIVGAVPITTFAKNKPLEIKLQLLRDVCRAVGEAHKQGVIHRDLKPSNILVNKNGDVKIIDFGIAKVIDDTIRPTGFHTQTGALLGTLQYMPPENELKTTCDVYSLGVIMYEMLAGQRPYELRGDSLQALMHAIATTDPTPIEQEFPVYKGPIASVVHKALAKNPSKRYATANEFAEDLQHLIVGTPVGARAEPFFVRLVRKHRTTSAVLAFTIPVLIAATAISIYFAIDANHQLVRNEKMLSFATDSLRVDRVIVNQQSSYWSTHVSRAKHDADVLTEHDPKLRAEMYGMLAYYYETESSLRLFEEAALLSNKFAGESDANTLIYTLKAMLYNGTIPADEVYKKTQEVLDQLSDGTPKEYVELFLLAAKIELNTEDALVRQQGHLHVSIAQNIAEEYHLNNDIGIANGFRNQAWSLIFKDGDELSLKKSIALLNENVIPVFEQHLSNNDLEVLRAKTLLAVAELGQSKNATGTKKGELIEEALETNEYVVEELLRQIGDKNNTSWQAMNNLALSLVEMANWMELKQADTLGQRLSLKNRAAKLWSRILQQSYFKEGEELSPHGWYLDTFQTALPAYAPSDSEWDNWVDAIKNPPFIVRGEDL